MSENTNDYLQTRVAQLERDLASANAEAKKHRLAKRQLAEEYAKYQDEASKAIKERDELRQRADAAPDELRSEVDRLKGEIRTRDHRGAFDAVAQGLGLSGKAIDDAWVLSGYKAEADQVDAAAIKVMLDGVVKERPYLVGEVKIQPTQTGTPVQNLFTAAAATNGQAGPGADRGAAGGVGFVVRKTDLRNVNWVQKNQDRMAAARKSGTLQYIDD